MRNEQTFNFGEDRNGRLYFGIDPPFNAVFFEDYAGNAHLLREQVPSSPYTSHVETLYEIVRDATGRHAFPAGPGVNIRDVSFISHA